MSWRRLQDMSSRRLQDMSSRHPQDLSSRRLQDVFSVRLLVRGLENVFKTSSRRLGRRKIVTLKRCWRRLQDMSRRRLSRRLEDQQMFAENTLTMIMCTLLSMVYGLFKPCWLIDVFTCFKKTTRLFHELFCGFYLVLNWQIHSKLTKNLISLLICTKLKVNTAWHRLGVFILDLDCS